MIVGNRSFTLMELYETGCQLLESAALAECDPGREITFLLEDVFGLDRGALLLHRTTLAEAADTERFFALCRRRAAGEPLQYVLGEWEFYSLPFQVGTGVLIPRPETELLVDTALELAADLPQPHIADLCSGSGCVAIALATQLPDARLWAVELSPDALGYLRHNLTRNGINAQRFTVLEGDALAPTTLAGLTFDLIVSNPPYISADKLDTLQAEVRREPSMALDGGADGLDFYRALPDLCRPLLRPGGALALEIGYDQEASVCALLRGAGYRQVECRRDLSGQPRVVWGRL